MPDTDYLAARAAKLWLAWNPVRTEFVPSVVADAVTEWAEAVASAASGLGEVNHDSL